MADDPVRIGQIFKNVAMPRRAWRVTARFGDNFRLERVDQPNIIRFPLRETLLDRLRYLPVE